MRTHPIPGAFPAPRPPRPRRWLLLTAAIPLAFAACDSEDKSAPAAVPAAPPAPALASSPPPPQEVKAPDIIVDPTYVAIGSDKVPTLPGGEGALVDRIGVFLSGRPMVEGQTVDVVAMRNAKPSQVAAVIAALRHAKATGAGIKTEARDNSTQRLPLSFTVPSQPCTTVAWIAKDAAIDVWPVSGGRARKVIKGLAGPDMTLGLEAVRAAGEKCDASALVVGADEAMTWGLIFDLATTSLTAPGSRTSAAVLVTSAVPGRKLEQGDK